MNDMVRAPIDLLRERRLELDLPAQPDPPVSAFLLLRRGALLGGLVLVTVSVATAVLSVRGRQQQQLLQAPIAQRLTASKAKLQRLKTQASSVDQQTIRIAQQLVAFSGGSPLLEQIRLVTPVGVQLQELSVGGQQIKLMGRVQIGGPPGPLERLNALVLALSQLPITREQGVKVMKITREDGDDSAVTFSLDWALNPTARLSLIQLQDLGASGLAERYRLLEQRGIRL